MDTVNIRLILIAVLACTVILLSAIVLFQRRKRVTGRRSRYIEALYALIEGRKEDAYSLLTSAVRNGETDIDAYIQLGNLMREKGQSEKALQLHRGLTVRRDLTFEDEKAVQLAIAEDLASLGRIERAVAALETVRKKRKDADVLATLHKLYHVQGDYENSYSALRDLSRIDDSVTPLMRSSYLTSVACSLIETGDIDRAGKYLDKARKEDGTCPGALYFSAGLAMDRGDLDRAAIMWEDLLSIDMGYFPEVATRLEKALFESGRFDELEGILSRLLLKYPSDSLLLSSLAGFYAKKGEISRGIDLLEGERGRMSDNSTLSVSLASLYIKSGRTDEALSVLEENNMIPSASGSWKCSDCGEVYETSLGFCRACCSFDSIQKNETIQ
ncbi:MAG: tetratricopeptide repeat protein [Candidatus Krumholzibacteria bacterium]|nr:tetratricopeptide repeat protein [Candidatus Krumholzibacteria bacterium]